MIEVHRYKVVKMLSEDGNKIGYEPHGPEIVLASSYDTLLAERDALRKDLESHKRMLLSAAVSIGTIGEALGAEMDDDPSELEGLATELRKDAEFHQQVQRGAGELPHGWEILIRIEKDAGNAELIDPEGNEVDYPSNHECLADSVSDAIDEALSAEKNG